MKFSNMKKQLILIALITGVISVKAQEDKNLVKNPGFEYMNGNAKLKKIKQIEAARDWKSPTGESADLFSASAKEPVISIPDNYMGHEKTQEGKNYAGIVAYSFGDKQPRTYLQTELLAPLKSGVKYCVQFTVSLAELSKYSCNNIGAHLSKRDYNTEEKKSLLIETHIKNSQNKIFNGTYNFETVCGIYTAQGGEKFLTIGNFSPTKETKTDKVDKPKNMKGTQVPIAYYYIDEVSVFQLDSIEECQCEKSSKLEKPEVVYNEQYASNKEFTVEEKVEQQSTVYFENFSAELNANGIKNLNILIDVLNANPDMAIEINAHSEKSELKVLEKNPDDARAKNLAQRRAETVKKHLIKGGIAEGRLYIKVHDDSKPLSTEDTELAKAKNRRVEFKIKN